MGDREKEVEHLIERELRPSGITDERVLGAIRAVRREKFLPPSLRDRAYGNYPLPIGTGSGYQAAILAELSSIVYTIERSEELALRARTSLYSMGYNNIYIIEGDGTRGLPEYAPYDRIIVTAAAPRVPELLVEQLAGKLVIPVGSRLVQDLKLVEKARNGRLYRSSLGGCRFVPLIGEEGFKK